MIIKAIETLERANDEAGTLRANNLERALQMVALELTGELEELGISKDRIKKELLEKIEKVIDNTI